MKLMLAVIAITIVIVWDFTQNGGSMTESAVRSLISFSRSFGH